MPSLDNIVISPFELALPGSSFVTQENATEISITLTLQGGSFSISVLRDSIALPVGRDIPISLPLGRVGYLRQTADDVSRGGLIDTFSGQMVPVVGSQYTAYSVFATQLGNLSISQVAQALSSGALSWQARDFQIGLFSFNGQAISGIQSLAKLVLAELAIIGTRIYVVPEGTSFGGAFSISKYDLISATQTIDYSKAGYTYQLAPGSVNIQGQYIYDDQHAQKQGDTVVSCGAPQGTGGRDFIEIPSGWMVEGTYDEWTPKADSDGVVRNFANPAAGAPKYWKVFPSPSGGGLYRGIKTFTRLVKDLKLPGQTPPNPAIPATPVIPPAGSVSNFVGSPITAQTSTPGSLQEFNFQRPTTQNGIAGFTADNDTVSHDIITDNKQVSVTSAFVLTPPGADSGAANSNFYHTQVGLWTFPLVQPGVAPPGSPGNPFNLPPGVIIVNPPSGQVYVAEFEQYTDFYLSEWRRINSRRLVTNARYLFRGGTLPYPGQSLSISSLKHPACGRINTVSLTMSRGGVTVNISAEVYNY